jgi:hypothetical protein
MRVRILIIARGVKLEVAWRAKGKKQGVRTASPLVVGCPLFAYDRATRPVVQSRHVLATRERGAVLPIA